MMHFLRRLARGCFLDHDYVKELVPKQGLIFRCQSCGHVQKILPKQKLRVKSTAKVIRIAERKRA